MDESFLDFRQDRDKYSLVQLAGEYGNLLVISSLTKMFAIPGLRLGYGICQSQRVEVMEYHKDTWNVNLLAQKAGAAALADKAYIEKTRENTQNNIRDMYNLLREIKGIKVYEPAVNFILLKLERFQLTSRELQTRMKKHGVLIRDCSNYPGLNDKYIRLAIRDAETNREVADILNKCLQG